MEVLSKSVRPGEDVDCDFWLRQDRIAAREHDIGPNAESGWDAAIALPASRTPPPSSSTGREGRARDIGRCSRRERT